jgi:hypothetical protein
MWRDAKSLNSFGSMTKQFEGGLSKNVFGEFINIGMIFCCFFKLTDSKERK